MAGSISVEGWKTEEKKKKTDILILGDFFGGFDRESNGRFRYLADMLCKRHDVELVTSDFNHGMKQYYSLEQMNCARSSRPYQVTFLHEGAYPKNVCLKRFAGHFIWGKSVKKYLSQRKKPDVVYCAIPPLSASLEAAKYCEKNNIRFIIDIQDLWPEAFQMVFHVPVIDRLIFLPFSMMADGIYRRADEICAVSQTYVGRAVKVNRKTKTGHSVFLGTRLEDFDRNVEKYTASGDIALPPKEGLWLGYCGSLGASYDLECVIDALSLVQRNGIRPPKFLVMGDGEKRAALEKRCKEQAVDACFMGALPYSQMCYVLKQCDIAVNPIRKKTAASIINKHADYAAAELPVLNTQEGAEYRELVDAYQMGLNCRSGDNGDLAEKMESLLQSEGLRHRMGANSRRCAEELFDREKTYPGFIHLIEAGNDLTE